jgi:ribokinase
VDAFGDAAAEALAAEGVGTASVRRIEGASTGVALILVDAAGENVIAVAPGANATLSAPAVDDALAALAIATDDVVLVSHEIPTAAARAALLAARRAGARSILNPAPAAGVDRAMFGLADVLTPNRSELATLAVDEARRLGRPSPAASSSERQAVALLERNAEGDGPGNAVVATLGAAGALAVIRDGPGTRVVSVPAHAAATVDATGAGDTFSGALAAGLAEGRTLESSVTRAVVAAALATTRVGARAGMPTAAELDEAIGGATAPG